MTFEQLYGNTFWKDNTVSLYPSQDDILWNECCQIFTKAITMLLKKVQEMKFLKLVKGISLDNWRIQRQDELKRILKT